MDQMKDWDKRIGIPDEIIEKHTPKKCMEKHCEKIATTDYNGHGHWVCDSHYESLTRYFEEEYD